MISLDDKLVVLFRFGSYNLNAVIEAAVLANSVRFHIFVAMRAFHKGSRRCFVVRKSLVRSALRLFILRYCHFITPLVLFFQFQYRIYSL